MFITFEVNADIEMTNQIHFEGYERICTSEQFLQDVFREYIEDAIRSIDDFEKLNVRINKAKAKLEDSKEYLEKIVK